MGSQAKRLIEFLIEKKRGVVNNINIDEVLVATQEIKIDENEYFNNRLARAVFLMAIGVNHKKLEFAKTNFYDQISSYCRRAIKTAVILKKVNAQ